jgi:methionyl-tRNA formyltransferase
VRIVFFGTPAFAIPSLEAVLTAGEIVAVVTRPAKPRGRGLHVEEPPVAVVANQYALEVLQPPSMRDPKFLARLRELAPDLIVTVAFGRLIPPEVLAIPSRGAINLHPSLLPRYRGAAPIPRAIAGGDPETGVTMLHISDELDAGDIIAQRVVPIHPEDTTETLELRLAREGAELLVEAIRLLEAGTAPRRPQDPSQVTQAPKLSREEAAIRWTDPAVRITNLVRALIPWPVAHTTCNGELLKIWRATALPSAPGGPQGPPGTILQVPKAEGMPIAVAAGDGAVQLHEVQPASGRRMSAAAYARGHSLAPGTVLGEGDEPSGEARKDGGAPRR